MKVERAPLVLAVGIALAASFGEGGRAPLALFVVHGVALLAMLLACLEAIERGGLRIAPQAPPHAAALASAWLILAGASALSASYPLAAALGFWDLTICAGLFVSALLTRLQPDDFDRLSTAVIFATSLQAVIALVRRPAGALAAAATFLNPDHLAAFLNLGLLLSTGRVLDRLERGRPRAGAIWASVVLLQAAAVVSLQSRGGLLGLSAGLLVLGCARLRSWPRRARLIGAAAAGLIVLAGAGLLVERFAGREDPYRYSRLGIWRAACLMIAERPLLGYGPGMFRHEGPRHNFASDVGPFRFEKVFEGGHSALLTMTAEEGVPAVACLIALGASVLRALLRSPTRAGHDSGRTMGAALAGLLAQGLVEDLQERPVLMLIPALLAGFALSVPRLAGPARPGGEGSIDAPAAPAAPVSRTFVKAIAALAAFYLFCVAVALPYAADRDARRARREGRAGLPRMERAARLDPLQPEYRHDLAMAILNSGPLTPERYAQAEDNLLEARRLKPIDGRFPLLLARLEALAGRSLFSDRTAADRAIRLYREAADLSPSDPRPLLELGGYLAEIGRDGEALEAIEKAVRLEPRFVRALILEASLLVRLGRIGEARRAFASLEAVRRLLEAHPSDSGYARDLAADAPAERERLSAELSAAGKGAGSGGPS